LGLRCANFLLIIVILLTASLVHAGHRGKWWKHPQIVSQIGLTAEQVSAIESIFDTKKIKMSEYKDKLLEKRKKLQEKISDPNAKRKDIDKQAEEVDKLILKLDKINREMILEIREVLTPEQRIKLQEIWKNRSQYK
jgi:periplasmic protein CpxP/Spy